MPSTLTTELMTEPINLPGVPGCIVTRAFAYSWLKLCGYNPMERGYGSLDFAVFGAPPATEPLSSYSEWAPLLEAVEADVRGLVILHVHGRNGTPPRLDGVWRFEARWDDLQTSFDRTGLLQWLSAHQGDTLSRIYDVAAVAPTGARIAWSLPRSEQAYEDSLPATV